MRVEEEVAVLLTDARVGIVHRHAARPGSSATPPGSHCRMHQHGAVRAMQRNSANTVEFVQSSINSFETT